MIILSFLVFAFMLIWMIASVLAIVLAWVSMDGNGGWQKIAGFFGGILSLVVWYQVLVWGEPWFRVLGSAWL